MEEVLFEHKDHRVVIDAVCDKDCPDTLIARELANDLNLVDNQIEILIINGHVLFDQKVVVCDFPDGYEPPALAFIGLEHLRQSGLLKA